MCRHEDRFFRRLRRLWILLRFCFIENTDLIRHDIVLLLAGRTEAGTLRVEQEFIHSLELLAQIPVFPFSVHRSLPAAAKKRQCYWLQKDLFCPFNTTAFSLISWLYCTMK